MYYVRSTYRPLDHDHVGMAKKPLTPYHPNAKRSQLPVATIVMPYKNSSQVVIGDRASIDKTHFKSINRQFQRNPNIADSTSNGGILAERVKWMHKHQY